MNKNTKQDLTPAFTLGLVLLALMVGSFQIAELVGKIHMRQLIQYDSLHR